MTRSLIVVALMEMGLAAASARFARPGEPTRMATGKLAIVEAGFGSSGFGEIVKIHANGKALT